MAAYAARADLPIFLRQAHTQAWKAPYLCSRWHVLNIASAEDRPEMMRARAFGKQLVGVLDQWAVKVRPATEPDEDYANAKTLLDLADWIGAPRGYGNIALAERSQDIATVPLSRLIVNLQYPLDKVQALVLRLYARGGWDPAAQAEMLNREAGGNVVSVEMAAEKARTFAGGQILMNLRKDPNHKGYSTLTKKSVMASPLAKHSDLRIFEDDDAARIGGVYTLSRMWEGKWHLWVGNGSTNVYNLPMLFEFRRVVGYLPGTKEEFRRVWDRHSIEKNRTLYARAWTVYTAINEGRFLDHDTLLEEAEARNQEVLRQIREEIGRSNP